MALSNYEERMIAELEVRLAGEDPARQLREQAHRRIAASLLVIFVGLGAMIAGVAWWWPIGAAGYGVALLAFVLLVREMHLRPLWSPRASRLSHLRRGRSAT